MILMFVHLSANCETFVVHQMTYIVCIVIHINNASRLILSILCIVIYLQRYQAYKSKGVINDIIQKLVVYHANFQSLAGLILMKGSKFFLSYKSMMLPRELPTIDKSSYTIIF